MSTQQGERSHGDLPPLLRRPTDGRTHEQVYHHYRLEKELAQRLLNSTREERTQIYSSMYQTLFAEVPDHPRLTRRADATLTAVANRAKQAIVSRFTTEEAVIGEFGAGDCRFAMELARSARKVYAIDIADQSAGGAAEVENLEVVVYDGYELPIPDETIDVMLSDQLLEHLHPEDVALHLQMVHRVLRPGGVYVIRTPHRFTGPHDVSKYFAREAEGFHLKEWTNSELGALVHDCGYGEVEFLRTIRGRTFRVPSWLVRALEKFLSSVPAGLRRRPAHYLVKEVLLAARK